MTKSVLKWLNREGVPVYGFQAEQIVLALVVWAVAFMSSLARSLAIVDKRHRGGRRDSTTARVAFACTSGFFALVWIGGIGLGIGNDWLMRNRFSVVCFSAFVGALGPEQQAIFIGTMLDIGSKYLKKNQEDDETK